MEEKKPLESRSLTHTSKEPEAQVWAQIGTSSYDPPIKATEEKAESNGETTSDCADPDLSKNEATNADEVASDLELHVDVNAELTEAEELERGAELKMDAKKRRVGDGFENDKSKEEKDKNKNRSRSRSRERRHSPERDSTADRTNSNDPRSIRSRAFVGHLNTDECTKEEVEKLFSPYGKIMGINLQNGYGFVQYDDEDQVRAAIKELHGTLLYGTKIVVDRPLALRRLEESRSRDRSRERSKDLVDELEHLRRRELHDRYSRLEEMERYYIERERRDYDRRDYDKRDYDRRDYDRRYPPSSYQGDYLERDRYRNQDRYSREDPYDSYERRGGYYMGRDDPYGYPPR